MDNQTMGGLAGIALGVVFAIACVRGPARPGETAELFGMLFARALQIVALAGAAFIAYAIFKLAWLVVFRW